MGGPENPESSAFKLRPKDARRRTPAKVQALEGWHKFFGRSHEQRPESRLLWLPALCRSRWVSHEQRPWSRGAFQVPMPENGVDRPELSVCVQMWKEASDKCSALRCGAHECQKR